MLYLKNLITRGILMDFSYQLSVLEPVPDNFIKFESAAPHAAAFLKISNPDQKNL